MMMQLRGRIGGRVTDWDAWRAHYPKSTFAEQQAFYAQATLDHPNQRDFDVNACDAFLLLARPFKVVEVGGFDGALADAMLRRFGGISVWWNNEISPTVVPVALDPRYWHNTLDDWPWFIDLHGDALILSHVVEHMLSEEFEQLVESFDGDWIYLDVPVGEEAENWDGYDGSHILEVGWGWLHEILSDHGFFERERWGGQVRAYNRAES